MVSSPCSIARDLLSVSQLNRETNQLLSQHFFSVWVIGEISNLSTPSSGHSYFSLKDATAQIRCAMFRNQQNRLRTRVRLENGKMIVVKAQVGLYEPRGDYQLIVEHVEEAGDGLLQKTFELLKQKLAAEGLFDQARKRELPFLPTAVGIITSLTGAAIRDILTVFKRRFPAVPIIIYPAAVQGEQAKYEIAQAIAIANQQIQCDVLIVARGGGSLEDLWTFNEELVARAIFASQIPVISGIGHETDYTIADWVADKRAATPSAAAEIASPDQQQLLNRYGQSEWRLQQLIQQKLNQRQQLLDRLTQRLHQQHPQQRLSRIGKRLGEINLYLKQFIHNSLRHRQDNLALKTTQLQLYDPSNAINRYRQQQHYRYNQLVTALTRRLERHQQHLVHLSQTLHMVSPLATLNRGYTLTYHSSSGTLARSVRQLNVGDVIETRLAEGSVSSRIFTITP